MKISHTGKNLQIYTEKKHEWPKFDKIPKGKNNGNASRNSETALMIFITGNINNQYTSQLNADLPWTIERTVFLQESL